MRSLVKGELAPQELEPQELDMGLSNINMNPIDVVEKLGKYEFIYDYQVPNFVINTLLPNNMLVGGLVNNATVTKEVATQQSIATSNVLSDAIKQVGQNVKGFGNTFNSPQPVSVNTNPQVGVFSKGDIVNVIRFEGSNAIIENPNYVALETTNVKPSWFSLLSQNVINKSEFMIPKEYLMKVKDNFLVTIQTGINFGANLKPQPAYPMNPYLLPDVKTPIKAMSADQLIEQNSTYVLNKDFGYNKTDNTNDHIIPDLRTLASGTKVTGNVFRPIVYYKVKAGANIPENQFDYLEVKGLTNSNSLKIPLSNLTKDIPTNSGIVVPVSNDNNNLLLIAGAVILGYALFSNDESE
jgi:hypothetical protein